MTRLITAALVTVALCPAAPAQVQARVEFTPDTLNVRSKGQWITCIIRLPEGMRASDINVSTIKLAGTSMMQKSSADKNVLTVKFNHTQVANYINNLAKVTPRFTFPARVTLTVTGTLKDGVTSFSGQDTVRALRSGGKKK
jgi:hypothetical protein